MSPRAVVRGRTWLEPLTPKSCKAVYRVEIEVRIVTVSSLLEQGLETRVRDSYKRLTALTKECASTAACRTYLASLTPAPPEPPLSLDALIREYVSRPPLPPPPPLFIGEPGTRARRTRRAARRLGRRRQRRQALAKAAGAAAASVAAATASVGGRPAASPRTALSHALYRYGSYAIYRISSDERYCISGEGASYRVNERRGCARGTVRVRGIAV